MDRQNSGPFEHSGAPGTDVTLIVGLDVQLVEAAARELEVAGWRSTTRDQLPQIPWDLSGNALLVTEELAYNTPIGRCEGLFRRGVRQVMHTMDWKLGCLYYDALQRMCGTELVTADVAPPTWRLDEVQHQLLISLAEGSSMATAAQVTHLSERTAARRVAMARELLGAPTTAAAAAMVGARLVCLAPPPPSGGQGGTASRWHR